MIEKLVGIKEVMAFLGVQRSTVYSWVHSREIPHYKIGRLVKFDPKELKYWLEKKRVGVVKYD